MQGAIKENDGDHTSPSDFIHDYLLATQRLLGISTKVNTVAKIIP